MAGLSRHKGGCEDDTKIYMVGTIFVLDKIYVVDNFKVLNIYNLDTIEVLVKVCNVYKIDELRIAWKLVSTKVLAGATRSSLTR
jgi:hypothetical protein